jgi:hypothetical protein
MHETAKDKGDEDDKLLKSVTKEKNVTLISHRYSSNKHTKKREKTVCFCKTTIYILPQKKKIKYVLLQPPSPT